MNLRLSLKGFFVDIEIVTAQGRAMYLRYYPKHGLSLKSYAIYPKCRFIVFFQIIHVYHWWPR